jgi:hypothetical protein
MSYLQWSSNFRIGVSQPTIVKDAPSSPATPLTFILPPAAKA